MQASLLCAPFCIQKVNLFRVKNERLRIMADWNVPKNCRFAKSDEWIRAEGAEATIGITDYAQDQLSDLVYVELPSVGQMLVAGEEFGVVESVKASAPLKMPAGGEVIAVNEALEGNEEIINKEPYEAGWIIRIKITDPSELSSLMDAEAYRAYSQSRA
jgi:glycine cleavage system H protein